MDNKYYIPNIEEFHVNFEYEVKENFTDGTVKTQEQYDNAPWIHKIVQIGDVPYINRALNGRNSEVKICGIRIKYLDKKDIESLGFKNSIYNDIECYIKDNWHLYWFDVDDILSQSSVYMSINKVDNQKGYNYEPQYFRGNIKNKSELIKLMKQLDI